VLVPRFVFVDQVMLVDLLGEWGIVVLDVVTDSAQQQAERGEPLLAIDHEPSHDTRWGVGGARGEHHGAEEVRRSRIVAVQRQDVVPQLAQRILVVSAFPAVTALVERDNILLLALEYLPDRRLARLHAVPSCRAAFAASSASATAANSLRAACGSSTISGGIPLGGGRVLLSTA
jgi:hypothetical protein